MTSSGTNARRNKCPRRPPETSPADLIPRPPLSTITIGYIPRQPSGKNAPMEQSPGGLREQLRGDLFSHVPPGKFANGRFLWRPLGPIATGSILSRSPVKFASTGGLQANSPLEQSTGGLQAISPLEQSTGGLQAHFDTGAILWRPTGAIVSGSILSWPPEIFVSG